MPRLILIHLEWLCITISKAIRLLTYWSFPLCITGKNVINPLIIHIILHNIPLWVAIICLSIRENEILFCINKEVPRFMTKRDFWTWQFLKKKENRIQQDFGFSFAYFVTFFVCFNKRPGSSVGRASGFIFYHLYKSSYLK